MATLERPKPKKATKQKPVDHEDHTASVPSISQADLEPPIAPTAEVPRDTEVQYSGQPVTSNDADQHNQLENPAGPAAITHSAAPPATLNQPAAAPNEAAAYETYSYQHINRLLHGQAAAEFIAANAPAMSTTFSASTVMTSAPLTSPGERLYPSAPAIAAASQTLPQSPVEIMARIRLGRISVTPQAEQRIPSDIPVPDYLSGVSGSGPFAENFSRELFELVDQLRQQFVALERADSNADIVRTDCAHLLDSVWRLETRVANGTARCGDQYDVSITEHYQVAVYDDDTKRRLAERMQQLRELFGEQFMSAQYAVATAEAAVESFIDGFLFHSHALSMPAEEPQLTDGRPSPVAPSTPGHSESAHGDIMLLRAMLSALFYFERTRWELRTSGGENAIANVALATFYEKVRLWITRLAGVLVRCPFVRGVDHAFLLDHVRRCRHMGTWAAGFVCFPPPERWTHYTAQHFVGMLRVLLTPIIVDTTASAVASSEVTKRDELWVLISNSGGLPVVTDAASTNQKPVLTEDDFVGLIEQCDFDALCRFLFSDAPSANSDERDWLTRLPADVPASPIDFYMAAHLYRYDFAFAVLRTLSQAFVTFSGMPQVMRLLGNAVVMVAKAAGRYANGCVEYIRASVSQGSPNTSIEYALSTLSHLQAEIDRLLVSAVRMCLSVDRHGISQFMSSIHLDYVSPTACWRIFLLLFLGTDDPSRKPLDRLVKRSAVDPNAMSTSPLSLAGPPVYSDWLRVVDDAESTLRSDFAARLAADGTEAVFQLHALAEIASAKGGDLGRIITAELFVVGYVATATTPLFFKQLRDALRDVCAEHADYMSTLLELASRFADGIAGSRRSVNSAATADLKHFVYLFRALPLNRWQPTASDISTLGGWLKAPLSDDRHAIGRLVLDGWEWPLDALTADVHRRVAMTIVDAHTFHSRKEAAASVFSRSGKLFADFTEWCWRRLLATWHFVPISGDRRLDPWDLTNPETAALRPAAEAVATASAAAATTPAGTSAAAAASPIVDVMVCYALLELTNEGTATALYARGREYLRPFVDTKKFAAALRVLADVLPSAVAEMSAEMRSQLHERLSLSTLISEIVKFDRTNGTKTGAGRYTHLLTALVTSALPYLASRGGPGLAADWTALWVQPVFAIADWFRNDAYWFYVDRIAKAAALLAPTHDSTHAVGMQLTALLGTEHDRAEKAPSKGLISFFTTPLKSRLPGSRRSVRWGWIKLHTSFTFEVLYAETRAEAPLRRRVGEAVARQPASALTLAVKQHAPNKPLHHFAIYRWADAALDLDYEEPLLPLFLQMFFALYFESVDGVIFGHKFLDPAQSKLRLKLLSFLESLTQQHTALAERFRGLLAANAAAAGDGVDIRQAVERHTELSQLYNAMALWLKDDVTALSEQTQTRGAAYAADRLSALAAESPLEHRRGVWCSLVATDEVGRIVASVRSEWDQIAGTSQGISDSSSGAPRTASRRSVGRHRPQPTRRYNGRTPPMPTFQLPAVVPIAISDRRNFESSVDLEIRRIIDAAARHATWLTTWVAMDTEFLELIPRIYTNPQQRLTAEKKCSVGCSRPAQLSFFVPVAVRNESVYAAVTQNRQRTVAHSKKGSSAAVDTDACRAVLRLHNTVDMLVATASSSAGLFLTDPQPLGALLFFRLAAAVTMATQHFAPTRDFLQRNLTVLGTHFISGRAEQMPAVLDALLGNPALLSPLLLPVFTPAAAFPIWPDLYGRAADAANRLRPPLLLPILEKFETERWLHTGPPAAVRSRMLSTLATTLAASIRTDPSDAQVAAQIWNFHFATFRAIGGYAFPEHFSELLGLLLDTSRDGRMPPAAWGALLDQPIATPQLPLQLVLRAVDTISEYLWALRRTAKQSLVAVWAPYIPAFVRLAAALSFYGHYDTRAIVSGPPPVWTGTYKLPVCVVLIDSALTFSPPSALRKLYDAWLTSSSLNAAPSDRLSTPSTAGPLHAPWPREHAAAGAGVLAAFTERLLALPEAVLVPLLPHVWDYAAAEVSLSTAAPHVVEAYRREWLRLPWHRMAALSVTIDMFLSLLITLPPLPALPPPGAAVAGPLPSAVNCYLLIRDVALQIAWQPDSSAYMRALLKMLSVLVQMHPLPLDTAFVAAVDALRTRLSFVDFTAAHFTELIAESPLSAATAAVQASVAPATAARTPTARTDQSLLLLRLLFAATAVDKVATLPQVDIVAAAVHGVDIRTQQTIQQASAKFHEYVKLVTALLTSAAADLRPVAAVLISEMLAYVPYFGHNAPALYKEIVAMYNAPDGAGSLGGSLAALLTPHLREHLVTHYANAAYVVSAACNYLHSFETMAIVVEMAMECHFVFSHDWSPVVNALVVPELDPESFLRQCVQNGSVLVLCAYCRQRANDDSRKMLATVLQWVDQIKIPTASPSGSSTGEQKMVLLWLHAAKLAAQVHDGANLLQLAEKIAKLGEDRIGGFFKIGSDKSPYSPAFRLACRLISAFLQYNVRQEGSNIALRATVVPSWQPSKHAEKALSALQNLANKPGKEYEPFVNAIKWAVDFISGAGVGGPRAGLGDLSQFMFAVATRLWPTSKYFVTVY